MLSLNLLFASLNSRFQDIDLREDERKGNGVDREIEDDLKVKIQPINKSKWE